MQKESRQLFFIEKAQVFVGIQLTGAGRIYTSVSYSQMLSYVYYVLGFWHDTT